MKSFLELGKEFKLDLEDKGFAIENNYLVKVFNTTIEFVLEDEDNKRVFGGDVNVSGFKDFGSNERKVLINAGSMGAVDNTCVATVAKHNLMSTALNNWEEFAESCELFMDKADQQLKNRLNNN